VKNNNKHRLKIKDWFDMETSESGLNRILALGWAAVLLHELPELIRAIADVLK
jgi:hypothetical protein